ncbi:MAG: hypothetical protein AAF152_03115 [Cyanobacteria bacterium P01_A01_bin.114]
MILRQLSAALTARFSGGLNLYCLLNGLMTVMILLVTAFASVVPPVLALPAKAAMPAASVQVAYNVDLEMDKARIEKTVEKQGESMREIVQSAHRNNENHPSSKPTAENTYERESLLNEHLPDELGEDFSKRELKTMKRAEG